MPKRFTIDPEAKLDYRYGWNQGWLEDGETIASHVVTVTSGTITVVSDQRIDDDTDVLVWVSDAALGVPYPRVTCHIVTSEGREDDRTLVFEVRER